MEITKKDGKGNQEPSKGNDKKGIKKHEGKRIMSDIQKIGRKESRKRSEQEDCKCSTKDMQK